MQDNLYQKYKGVIAKATNLLSEHIDWQAAFAKYIEAIHETPCPNLRLPKDGCLKEYTTISLETKHPNELILRYKGQEVARVCATDHSFEVKITSSIATNNQHYFAQYAGYRADILGQKTSYPWASPNGTAFRAFFANPDMSTKSNEHAVESALISDLEQPRSENKQLKHIQPIKLNGRRFQMKTPLSASKGEITYSGTSGGGIDILAKYKHGNASHLVVIELKDSNEEQEPPQKVMKQAIAYATFLAKLMESPSGAAWYQEIFKFSHPPFPDMPSNPLKPLVIKCAVAMPDIKDMREFDDDKAAARLEIDDKIILELGCIRVANGKVEEYSSVFR